MKYPQHIRFLVTLLIVGFITSFTNAQSCLSANFEYYADYEYDGCSYDFEDLSSGDITSWEWNYGDGETEVFPFAASPSHFYAEEGDYTVTLTVSDGTNEDEYSVIIDASACDDFVPDGEDNISVTIIGNSQIYGETFTDYEAQAYGGSGPYLYTWDITSQACDNIMIGPGLSQDVTLQPQLGLNCNIGDFVTLEVTAEDINGNTSTSSISVQLVGEVAECGIKTRIKEVYPSGGGWVKMRIKESAFLIDCYNQYPYWLWDFGDGTTPFVGFWAQNHDYESNGEFTITATGLNDPDYPTDISAPITKVICLDGSEDGCTPIPLEPEPDNYFAISPPNDITAAFGLPFTEPLSIDVLSLIPDIDNNDGEYNISGYTWQWIFTHQETGEIFTLNNFIDYDPGIPEMEFNNSLWADDVSGLDGMGFLNSEHWGCFDVRLEIFPWGTYEGFIDTNCDGIITRNAALQVDEPTECTVNGNNTACYGCIGDLDGTTAVAPVRFTSSLSVSGYSSFTDEEWACNGVTGGIAASFGCVPGFPVVITETCKIFVEPEPPVIDEIIVGAFDDCDAILVSVETSLGAITYIPVPDYAPCSGTQPFPEYYWKAYDINNPTVQIRDQYTNEDGSPRDIFLNYNPFSNGAKCIEIDRTHPYFSQFDNDVPRFMLNVEVEDNFGIRTNMSKIISAPNLMQLSIPTDLTRCPGVETQLHDFSLITGGSNDLIFEWGGADFLADAGSEQINNPNPTFSIPDGNNGDTRSYSVTITDDYTNCMLSAVFVIEIQQLMLNLPDGWIYACISDEASGSTSTQTIGPGDAEIGGSGDYQFIWTSNTPAIGVSMLSNPWIANPIVEGYTISGLPNISVGYTLTIIDNYGGCQVSDEISVRGDNSHYFNVSAFEDASICFGDEHLIYADLSGDNPPPGNVSFNWTSDNPNFSGGNTSYIIVEGDYNTGTYNYNCEVTTDYNGCTVSDEVEITVEPQITYGSSTVGDSGYESNTFYITGSETSNFFNAFESSNNYIGGGTSDIYSWEILPGGVEYEVLSYNSKNVPSQISFSPTHSISNIVLHITNETTGCDINFISNRYYVLNGYPTVSLNLASDNLCIGEEVCFDVYLNLHYGSQQLSLPTTQTVNVITGSFSNEEIELELFNQWGFYRGTYCRSFTDEDTYEVKSRYNYYINGWTGNVESNPVIVPVTGAEVPAVCKFCGTIGEGFPTNNILLKGMQVTLQNEQVTNPSEVCHSNNAPNCSGANIIRGVILGGEKITLKKGTILTSQTNNGDTDYILLRLNDCFYPEPGIIEDDINAYVEDDESQSEADIDIEKKAETLGKDNVSLTIVPNPSSGAVNIRYFIENDAENASLQLFDFTGRNVETLFSNRPISSGNHSIGFSSQLPPGTYFYVLNVDGVFTVAKSIISSE